MKPEITEHPKGHIPAGENPYWHDEVNVGLPLGDFLMDDRLAEVEVMSYNTFDKTQRQFQIIDKTTGERWVVTLCNES
jgi:hypothetical protein